MDDALRAEIQAIGQEADDLAEQVENALDEHATHSFTLETRRKVDELSARYRQRIADLSETDRFAAERIVGRKVVDVAKMAMKLPAPPQGRKAELSGKDEFFGTRAPSSSRAPLTIGAAAGVPRRTGGGYRVTDEIEAWCGACKDLKTHVIAAMVGDQPAQVVCQRCGGRHKYRTGPARAAKAETPTGLRPGPSPTSTAAWSSTPVAQSAKDVERNKLVEALRTAENVRSFSPKERYKAGEIIDHPEHGRGKIENTLPRSLLVRFASGLKQVKLS